MNKTKCIAAALLALASIAPARAVQQDAEGGKDHPLLSRMPNYYIYDHKELQFDRHEFYVAAEKATPVEGRYYWISYSCKDDVTPASALQILRNYENAVRKAGGAVVYSDGYKGATFKVVQQGREVWIELQAGQPYYDLTIVEKEIMQQDVRANAVAWMADINASGHAAVYGIYFDTGSAAIKPESGPALAEIAALLQKNPKLNVRVVGHTDGSGAFAHNMTLSEARAAAVVGALTARHGVSPSRLKASGAGSLAPVASNRTEEGKAQNRRVELVEE